MQSLPGYLHILQHTPRLWWAYYYYYLCCIGLSAYIIRSVVLVGEKMVPAKSITNSKSPFSPLFSLSLSLSFSLSQICQPSSQFCNLYKLCANLSLSLSIPSFFGLTTFSWFQQTMQTSCEVWPQFFTTCSEMICTERERERERFKGLGITGTQVCLS